MRRKIRSALVMWGESIRMALDNIRGNKVRSFLTLLGIMIGVMAVITLITTVSGVSGSISSSFSSLGVGTLTVNVTGSDLKTGMTPEDLSRIAALDTVDGVVPNVSLMGRVSYGRNVQTTFTVAGRNAYYFQVNEDLIVQGRSLNFVDDDNRSYVCVISQNVVDAFFLGVNPIGETLYVAGLPFTIVGRFDEDSGGGIASIFSGSPDVIMPYTTGLKVNNSNEVTSFTVYLKEGAESSAAQSQIEETMDVIFDFEEDCYTVASMETIEERMETMTTMMSSLLAGIATVTERTAEIGLKKALGAIPWQIQSQFLLESFMLSLFGGLCGAAMGLILSYILCQVLGTSFVFNGGAVLLGVGFSAAVGIIFGWAPARKASRLNPIDALRAI